MTTLTALSYELLHGILAEVTPEDLAALSETCRALNHFIKENVLLWKLVYLRTFDAPKRDIEGPGRTWSSELQRLTDIKKRLESDNYEVKRHGFDLISAGIVDLLRDAATDGPNTPSRNLAFLSHHFDSKANVDALLCASSLWREAGAVRQRSRADDAGRQMSARLHSLYGIPVGVKGRFCTCPFAPTVENSDGLLTAPALMSPPPSSPPESRGGAGAQGDAEETVPIHPYARAKVYDLRNYTVGSMWGPFVDDGSQRVDWEKVEAIMVDLVYNMWRLHERSRGTIGPWWGTEGGWAGATSGSYVPKPKATDDDTDETDDIDDLMPLSIPRAALEECPRARDPYGVTGTWMRVVCFLDYNDFYAYNFGCPIPPHQSRPPLDVDEATRLISLELCVTTIEPPGPADGQALPVVHFVGTSRSMHAIWDPNAYSRIKGTVRLTPEGEVRWTTFSIFHNDEERWRSEGIQVGGVRSGRGILGNWFDKDFDERGPAGPTAFWKISDEVTGLDVESDSSSEMGDETARS